MKKSHIIILIAIICLSTGCSTGISKEKYDKVVKERDDYKKKYETLLSSTNTGDESTADAEKVKPEKTPEELLKDIAIVQEYQWSGSGYHYAGLELKNNTGETLQVNAEFIFYDAANNIIGTKKENCMAFGSKSSAFIYKANESEYDHYEYTLTPSIDTYHHPVISDLKSDVSDSDKKLIFSITNSGKQSAQFVHCVVLFFRGGEVVGHNTAYASDADNEIKPDATEHAEVSKPYNTPFDEYRLYIDGRAIKK